MHELAITQSIVDAITDRVGDERVSVVHLEIGALAGIVPDSVCFCFDLVSEGTGLAGAELEISRPQGRSRCRECGSEFEHEDPIAACRCGGVDLDVLSGRELRIVSVEVV
ncbi:hydrogenase maturation nickel metallochaperone HypA [Actinospica sp. MGRD01-02]|uniref:Hydrogenase maturation factor HypA n=1 Tax=Actinospica acidithermotolerans TaxID=2828514 RepID=A0A941EAV8_9ACTN|nr:hydrogenase maturation nickel metallochaperone HypA [Actinospica acidithermotolerans]MBR7827047.1 hydrogenase maturation nickel metallochaperone HypA [Actinospica acidithermotolerans]